jgi:hypothetical protein
MTGLDIAGLLKEYGPWGLCSLLLLALRTITNWWADCMRDRLADRDKNIERMAVALERQAASNADLVETMKELREGQVASTKLATEAALSAAGSDKATLEKLSDIKAGIEKLPRGVS